MILASTDSQQSFDSINKWRDLIRKQFANEPIFLVLVDKSQNGDAQPVTLAMMQNKSDEENFEGVISLNFKDDHKKFCSVLESAIA